MSGPHRRELTCRIDLITVKQNIAECEDHWRPTFEDLVGDWGLELQFIGSLPSVLFRCKTWVLGAGIGCGKRGAPLKHLCYILPILHLLYFYKSCWKYLMAHTHKKLRGKYWFILYFCDWEKFSPDSVNQGCHLDILTKLLCRFLSNASQRFEQCVKNDENETLLICIPDLSTVCWGGIKDSWSVNWSCQAGQGRRITSLLMAHPRPVYWFHFCVDKKNLRSLSNFLFLPTRYQVEIMWSQQTTSNTQMEIRSICSRSPPDMWQEFPINNIKK